MAFPRWLRGSRPDAAIHPGWRRWLDALGAMGIATELDAAALIKVLRADLVARAPDPDAIAIALDGYYRGRDRAPEPGKSGKVEIDVPVRRSRLDRYVSARETEGATARQIVAKLRLAIPELGGLALVEEPAARYAWASPLLLRARGALAPLPVAAVELEAVDLRDGEYVRRTVTVRALMNATNGILAKRGIAWRFLPIESPDGVEAYLAVTRDQAAFLERAALWAEPLESLLTFAAWRPDPPAILSRARRGARRVA